MNDEVIRQWDRNKENFKSVLDQKVREGSFIYEYPDLLSLLIKHVINHHLPKKNEFSPGLHPLADEEDKITTIQVGQWNGEYLFILRPKDNDYASVSQLWITKVFYGSCSGCDMMQDADYGTSDPSRKVELLMNISLGLIQELKPMSILYPV